MQGAEAVTVFEGRKEAVQVGSGEQVPFAKPLTYTYSKLTEDYIFKFAITQDEEFLGILYLEIPYKYKYQKRFKIDDWFALKNPDRKTLDAERSPVAWVVLKYNANVKLSDDPLKNLEASVEPVKQEAKRDLQGTIKEVGKAVKQHEKEGFQHLEEVERRIRDRRRRGVARASVERSVSRSREPAHLLAQTLSLKKERDLGVRDYETPRKLAPGKQVTPDDLFDGGDRRGGSAAGAVNAEAMSARMAQDYANMREELARLRARVKSLEEGQMTVDNLQLARNLAQEKEELNKERAKLLRDFAARNEELERAHKKQQADLDKKAKELEAASQKSREREEAARQLEAGNLDRQEQLDRLLSDNKSLQLLLDQKLKDAKAQQDGLEQQRKDLALYAVELDEMKDNLISERSNILDTRSKTDMSKGEADRLMRELEKAQKDFEREKEKLAKENKKLRDELAEKEEKLKRDRADLQKKIDDLESTKSGLDSKNKQASNLNESLEEANIQLLRDRNKLNLDIKDFIQDKKQMEDDLKRKRRDAEEERQFMEEERRDLEQEREEFEQFQKDLEKLKEEVEARERKLQKDMEAFHDLKKKFIEGIMQSGSYDQMTPEMKKMAKDLGVDIDELIEEDKRIKERRAQLDRLKKENDETLYAWLTQGEAQGCGAAEKLAALFAQEQSEGPAAGRQREEARLGEPRGRDAAAHHGARPLQRGQHRVQDSRRVREGPGRAQARAQGPARPDGPQREAHREPARRQQKSQGRARKAPRRDGRQAAGPERGARAQRPRAARLDRHLRPRAQETGPGSARLRERRRGLLRAQEAHQRAGRRTAARQEPANRGPRRKRQQPRARPGAAEPRQTRPGAQAVPPSDAGCSTRSSANRQTSSREAKTQTSQTASKKYSSSSTTSSTTSCAISCRSAGSGKPTKTSSTRSCAACATRAAAPSRKGASRWTRTSPPSCETPTTRSRSSSAETTSCSRYSKA